MKLFGWDIQRVSKLERQELESYKMIVKELYDRLSEFLDFISRSNNQTRELFKGYQRFGDAKKKGILNEVCIMTPEHIHINSFMYEPLLDMDITELLGLYRRVKTL